MDGRSNMITITRDKGHLSKEEIERMVADAAKYRAEDEQVAQNIQALTDLEYFAYNLRNILRVGSFHSL